MEKAHNPVAWGVVIFVVLTLGGWRMWALTRRPAHLMEMAAEVGSFGRFIGNSAASEDGSRVSFFRGTEKGDGLFVCDLASGKERLLYEDEGTRRHAQFGWSPDGKLLAFPGIWEGKAAVLVYDVDSGQVETGVPGTIKEVVWMSPTSFAFVHGELKRMEKRPGSGWTKALRFAKAGGAGASGGKKPFAAGNSPHPGPVPLGAGEGEISETQDGNPYPAIKGLMALSPDSVAWVGDNAIWEWRFHGEPARLFDGGTNALLGCCYSKDKGAFLLRLRDAGGERLARLSLESRQLADLGSIPNANATNFMWINGGRGYACLLNESGTHKIGIKADCFDQRPIRWLEQDGLRGFVTGGHCLYAVGSLEDQPRGVVEYDLISGSSRYVVASGVRFHYARIVRPSSGMLTNSLGSKHAYRLWAPVRFDPKKKYPLVLSQGLRAWSDEQALTSANGGAYYLSVERPEFNHPQIGELAEDVIAAYELMSRQPNIDTNSIYLSGASAETAFLVHLLDERPTLWKGAMLTSPVAFPDVTRTRVSKLLINCGDDDEYHVFERVQKFQEDAAIAGIPVTVAAHRSGHVFLSSSANKESTQQFVSFLFE